MHRLIVVLLAAVDALIAAAVGIAATLAPLTLIWVLGLGGTADWGAIWPTGAAVWQFGHLVPLQVTLPGNYLAAAGIDPSAASFALSLAPLTFASFTAIFAARSGLRASQADAWITGVLTGSVVFAALSTLIALTSANRLAQVEPWQAILFPALVFAIPLLAGALVTEWREAGSGVLARLRDRVEAAPSGWGEVPGLLARGSAVVVAGLIGLGALVFAVSLLLRGGEVIALYEAAHVDALGATVLTLAQLAYLPTLVIWGMAFVAGPGFAVGVDTAVSPAGTQLGVIPGIPVLGALPESTTSWLLLLALLPVALGALAGWVVRSRLAAPPAVESAPRRSATAEERVASDSVRSAALAALLAGEKADRAEVPSDPDAAGVAPRADERRAADPIGPRAVLALGIAVVSAGAAALLALLASGSLGPGRLAEAGPQPGPVALAVGAEVLVGAAILLLSPGRRTSTASEGTAMAAEPPTTGGVDAANSSTPENAAPDRPPFTDRPFTDRPFGDGGSAEPDEVDTVDLGPRRPAPLPPVD